jgi:hypothetical protein
VSETVQHGAHPHTVKRRFHIEPTLVISIVALLISLISAYFQYFYHPRHLNAILADFDASKSPTITGVAVFENEGTHPEVILWVKYLFEKGGGTVGEFSSNSIGPFVVEPQHSLVKYLNTPTKDLDNAIGNASSGSVHVSLDVLVLDPNGARRETKYPFTELSRSKGIGWGDAKPEKSDDTALIDLLYHGQIGG